MRLVYILGVVLLFGCGHQGLPRPLENTGAATGLKPITEVKTYFQGRQIRVDWRLPDLEISSPIRLIQVSLDSFKAACLVCGSQEKALFALTLGGGLLHSPEFIEQAKSWKNAKGLYSLIFTPEAGTDWNQLVLQLRYQSESGALSPKSAPSLLFKPAKLPVPSGVRARWVGQKPKQREGQPERGQTENSPTYRLQISWSPKVERQVTEVTEEGGLLQRTDRFGLLVFSDALGQAGPLRPTAMLTGQGKFEFPKSRRRPTLEQTAGPRSPKMPFSGPIWVRFQDRFGNLSEPVSLTPKGP